MIHGGDFSVARPSPAALYAAGWRFACRYLAYSHATAAAEAKFLTADELAALHNAGLAVVATFESTSARALDGAAAGSADGTDARVAMSGLGFPVGSAVYASVDVGTVTSQLPAIAAYMAAFETALVGKYRLGVYGGSVVRAYLVAHGLAPLFWQAAALSWSGGRWDPTAQIQQRGATNIAGTDADTALVADYGQWAAPQLPETDTEVAMPIYTLGGMRTGQVAAGTPYYTNPGDATPRSTIPTTGRFFLTAYDATGAWIALDGKYAGPTGTTPQMCGWVKASAVTAIEPVVRPYHVDLEVTSSAAPVVTVTQA